MSNTVWLVDRQCSDPFYAPHTIAVYDNEDAAKKFADEEGRCSVREVEVRTDE